MGISDINITIQVVIIILFLFIAFIMYMSDRLSVILFGSVLLISLACLFMYRTDVITKDSYCYVGMVGKEPYVEVNRVSGYRQIPEGRQKKLGISEDMLKDYSALDRVELKVKDDLSKVSFLDILLCKESKWLDISLNKCSGYIILDGSDIEVATDTVKHVGARGGVYYTDKPYIRYKNALYDAGETKEIDKNTTYILLYDTLSKDKVNSLLGDMPCYTNCLLYEYKK